MMYITFFYCFPIALYKLRHKLLSNNTNLILFVLLISLIFIPLFIISLTGASWGHWVHFRGYFPFLPTILFLSLTLIYRIDNF